MSNINQNNIQQTFDVSSEFIEDLKKSLEAKNYSQINRILKDFHPSDIAEIISNLPIDERFQLVSSKVIELPPEIFVEFNDEVQREILNKLSSDYIAKIINGLESDNAIQIITSLEEDKKIEVFEKIPRENKKIIEEILKIYPEDSAAHLMQREYASVPQNWSVGQTIDYLRDTNDLPQEFLLIFIVNQENKLIGSVPSSRVLRSSREADMQSIMNEYKFFIYGSMDKEEVGNLFEQYNLVSAPVVDKNNHLIGMITADDVITVVKEETEEDALKLVGVQDEEITDSALKITQKRFVWLFINLLTAILASYCIGFFDGNIQRVVALAVLMPIVASMGGNAGTQTLTVTVRLLATQDLISQNMSKIITKEFIVGFFNGVLFALVSAVIVYLWFNDFKLSILIAVAMVINMTIAGISGILIPVFLDKIKIDPAIASSVFVTTVTDVAGFVSFLGLAGLVFGF